MANINEIQGVLFSTLRSQTRKTNVEGPTPGKRFDCKSREHCTVFKYIHPQIFGVGLLWTNEGGKSDYN